jgi:hypothetical protein
MTKKTTKREGSEKYTKRQESSLEDVYRQYLTPMPVGRWKQINDLSQPSTLKTVPTHTVYGSVN